MDRLVKLGILKKGVYEDILAQPWQLPEKIVTYLELLVIFRYLNKRLVKFNMTFPLS